METKELGFETICKLFPILEPEPYEGDFLKHGDHDQSSHGSWATNNFDEDTEYAGAASLYAERYGVDENDIRVGVTNEEHDAIDDYSQTGYKRINGFLRGSQNPVTDLTFSETQLIVENDEKLTLAAIDEYSENNVVGSELTESELESAFYEYTQNHSAEILERINSSQSARAERNQPSVDALDSLIEKSPAIFGDKTLYRVYSDRVLADIKEGDIVQDRGFLSTTRIDLTNANESANRDALADITSTDDTVAVILPNESKSGKGIAVDIYRTMVNDTSPVADREKEILLPRNTSLKFIGYKTDVGNEPRVAVFQRLDK